MSFKPINRKIIPDTFKKACCMYPIDNVFPDTTLLTTTFATSEITTSSDEYIQALAGLMLAKMPNNETLLVSPYTTVNNARYLNGYMFLNYGNRKLFKHYFDWFDIYENKQEECEFLRDEIIQDIYACSKANIYKWSNLLKSTLLEFNPLWNVDGVVGEIRETTHTGTDTTSHTGTDTTTRDGSNNTTRTGNFELEYLGTKYNDKEGKEVTTNSGTDTSTLSKTTTESQTYYGAEKTEMLNGKTSTLSYDGKTANDVYRDTEHFTERKDKTTYNQLKDAHSIDESDETSYDSEIEKLLNLKDKDLFMQIKQGNIGVTTTTKLLTEFQNFINIRVVDVIAKDLINAICEGVY